MKKGYVNGSDMLLFIGGKAVGHCTSHTCTFSSETVDRAVKPKASAPLSSSLWQGKGISGLSYSIRSESLAFYNEDEFGFADMLAAWKMGESIEVKCAERSNDAKPYLTGSCVITSLEQGNSARQDSTLSISLENDGEPEIDETNLTVAAAIQEAA